MSAFPTVLALSLFVLPNAALAMDVAVTESWTLSLDATDLESGATNLLVATHEALSDEIVVAITAVDDGDGWRMAVRWPDARDGSDVGVWVRRTSDGSGAGSVSGGTAWVAVTSAEGTFFTGVGDRSDVGIELRVTGLSLTASPPDAGTLFAVADP